MGLIAKDSGGGEFEQAPEGNFVARCFKLVDLGTQTTEFSNETKSQAKILLSWELLDDDAGLNKDGQPFILSKRYTLSLHEKSSLRADLQAWRGKAFTQEELDGFDLQNILGTYCQVQIVHTENGGKTYADLSAIMSFKGEKPKPVMKDVLFDLTDADMQAFSEFSDKLQETIKASPEWQAIEAMGGAPEETGTLNAADFPPEEAELPPVDDDLVETVEKEDEAEKAASRTTKWITTAQRKIILTLCDRLDAEGVAERLELVGNELDREVRSFNELSYDDAETAIAALNAVIKARAA